MSLAAKQPQTSQRGQQPTVRRIWKAPTSNARWLWLGVSLVLFAIILVWYIYALRTQATPNPFDDPLRLFGIVSFVLVLGTASYSLRRRFVRGLPGKVQDWLWMHTWIGIIAILIALLHENFALILNSFLTSAADLVGEYWGPLALFSLIFLVVSGLLGRLLDVWQTHAIAHEASLNGVGIERAVKERVVELEYVIERLSAGKSEPFKQYCFQALSQGASGKDLSDQLPIMPQNEQMDFQQAYDTLKTRTRLIQSLHRQERARKTMNLWRTIHITLAVCALITILYHGIMELLVNVFNIIKVS
jgi:hypothetical protein